MLQRVGTPDNDVRRGDISAEKERQRQKDRRASKLPASGGEAKRASRGGSSTPSSNEHANSERTRGPETDMVLAARDGTHGPEKMDGKAIKTKSRVDSCDDGNDHGTSQGQRPTEDRSSSGPSRRSARPVGVDAGTDPMDSFAVSVLRPQTPHGKLLLPQIANSHHEMETQTAPPPAAPIAVPTGQDKSLSSDKSTPQQFDIDSRAADGVDAPWEPEFDGIMLEKEMKSFLLQHAKTSEHETGGGSNESGGIQDNQDDVDNTQEQQVVESPRLDAVKSAELRQPPTARSRQGYCAFRMPMRPISPNVAG